MPCGSQVVLAYHHININKVYAHTYSYWSHKGKLRITIYIYLYIRDRVCQHSVISMWTQAYYIWSRCGHHFDGLMQDCNIPSALAMEILQSFTKPSISTCVFITNLQIPVLYTYRSEHVPCGPYVIKRRLNPQSWLEIAGSWPSRYVTRLQLQRIVSI